MKRLFIPLYLLLSLLTASCESFLDVNPKGTVEEDKQFANVQGFREAMYGAYATIASKPLYGQQLSWGFTDQIGQMFVYASPGQLSYKAGQYSYQVAEVREVIDNIWSALYQEISYVNNIIEHAESTALTDPDITLIKGEAYALRAYLHFDVLRLFADDYIRSTKRDGIPYSLHYDLKLKELLSLDKAYEQVLADLTTAEEALKDDDHVTTDRTDLNSVYAKLRYMHMNKYAVYALKARVYHAMGKNEEAARYARLVIGSTDNFQLANGTTEGVNAVKRFPADNEKNKELIFGLYTAALSKDVADVFVPDSYNEGTFMQGRRDLNELYELSEANLSPDIRYARYYFASGKVFQFTRLVASEDDKMNGLCMLRLPKMYYILCESIYDTDRAGAIAALNAVRASRGLADVLESKVDTKAHLMQELLRERMRAEPTAENIHAALRYLVMRETGRILGFLDNYAASSAYDVESLRSAKFTREHGLAPSVMDETEFNYVAQPGDKGVLFTPTTLGEYDYFLVKWNYTYFGDDRAAADKQLHTLEKWMDKKADDPRYRFSGLNTVDPRALAGDLGDDPIRAAGYGVANLQRTMKHLTKWVKDDEDTRKKDPIYLQMAQQYHKYLKNVLALIGGVYLNQTKEGASTPRYRVVDTDTQRKALEWSYNYVAHFTDFAGRDFERKDFFSIGYFDQLIEYVANDFFARRRNVLQSSYMTPGSYSQREYYDDVYRLLFGGIDTDRRPNHTEMFMQHLYLAIAKGLVRGSINDAQAEPGAPSGKASLYLEMVKKFGEVPPQYLPALDGNGFGDPSSPLLPNVNLKPFDRAAVILCELLPRLQKDLETRLETEKDSDLRAHLSMILHKVKDILDETSK